MMPSVTLGGSPASVQQKGERGGKNAELDGKRFDEALTGRAGERGPAKGDTEDREMETPQDYRIDRYAALFRLDRSGSGRDASGDRSFEDAVAAHASSDAQDPSFPIEAEASAEEAGDTEEPDAALALLQGLAEDKENAKAADRQAADTGEAKDSKNASHTALGRADMDGNAQQPAASASEQQVADAKRASAARAAERAPAPPAEGQSPTRTRTDTRTQVAAAADKPAPTAQPPLQAQQDTLARPAVAGAAATDGDIARFVSAKEASFARDASSNTMSAKPDPVSARVNVLNFTAAAAPVPAAPPVLGTTAASLIAAIEADGTWRMATPDPTAPTGSRGTAAPAGVNTLRIQLQPAELGMVTARLVASGSQLSVEIQVESNDARQRLANDSEAIVKALRAVGYDVEKVTIQQAPQGGQSAAQQQGASGRNDQIPHDQQSDRDARGRGGQGAGRDSEGARNGSGEAAADRIGGGRYI